MKLLVTGGTGYIGAYVIQCAVKRGHEVIVASRYCPADQSLTWMHYDLASDAPIELPSGTQAVLHLAANALSDAGDRRETLSAGALIAAAQRSNAKLVFVSSQTARPNAPTVYGRTKWHIEQKVLATGGWVVRPGQVYGGCERGLFGQLVGIVRWLPVLPSFLPAPKVQPIHVEDLAEGLLRIIERNDMTAGVICLASSQPVSFTRFLRIIAFTRVYRRRRLVPVPVKFVQAVCRMLNRPLRLRRGLERLSSLFLLPVMDTRNDLQRLGLVLRPLTAGMYRSDEDRQSRLIGEGHAMLTYVLKEYPGAILLRRYVRAVENLRGGLPLGLPTWVLSRPAMLALFDDHTRVKSVRNSEFAWRLDAATTLAEATPQGARRFLGVGQSVGPLRSLASMAHTLVVEIFWRLLRVVGAPLIQGYTHNTGDQL